MKSLNLGKETAHDHQNDEHADHDHRGARLSEQWSRNGTNTSWEQVSRGMDPMMAIHVFLRPRADESAFGLPPG